MPQLLEILDEAERMGVEWLVRSVGEHEAHMSGSYFVHIHGSELVDGSYVESFQGQASTREEAASIAYESMMGASK